MKTLLSSIKINKIQKMSLTHLNTQMYSLVHKRTNHKIPNTNYINNNNNNK